jgi:lysophospholipase L1-like esterase
MKEDPRREGGLHSPSHRGNIPKSIAVALLFWAVIIFTWNLSRIDHQMPLSSAQRVRLANLGNLPDYREANAALKPDPNRIVFFGDSITHGWNLDTSFPNSDSVNRGINGQTSSDMLVRFREDVIALQPKAVVILAGVNDFGEHNRGGDDSDVHKLAHLEANYQTMAELAQLHKIRPVFVSLLPLHAYTRDAQRVYSTVSPAMIVAANKWLREYCAMQHYLFIDAYSAVADDRGMLRKELSDDGMHPNAAGYRVMASAFPTDFQDR